MDKDMSSCCGGCQSGMACESGLSGLYGLDGLSGLMGQIGLAPIKAGAAFQLGFNEPLLRDLFADPAEIAGWVVGAGLARDARSYKYAGAVYPFIVLEGRSTRDYPSGGDLKDALLSVIVMNGYDVDFSTVQFHFEAAPGSAPPVVHTGPPGSPGVPPPPPPPGQCSLRTQDFGDWVACQLGIKSPLGGVGAGAAGALIGVGVITLLAVVLLKR